MNPTLYGPDGKPLAPSVIGLSKKSIVHPGAEDAAVSEAMRALQTVDGITPILFNRDIIGWTDCDVMKQRITFYRKPAGMSFAGISTYDDIIALLGAGRKAQGIWSKGHTTAPVANNWMDMWPVGGAPAAGAYGGTALTAKQFSDTTTGSLYMGGNVNPTFLKYVLGGWAFASAGTPSLMIYDRVLTYETCSFSASVQSFVNTLTPQRYVSAGQSGLKVLVTNQALLGSTAANITALQYTDQDGNALQSMPTTRTVSVIISAAAPTTTLGARVVAAADSGGTTVWSEFLPLANGDSGVRQLTTFTCSAANTGTLCFVLMRPLFFIPTGTAGIASMVDGVFQLANLEQIYDGACLSFLAYFPAATAATWCGEIDAGWN